MIFFTIQNFEHKRDVYLFRIDIEHKWILFLDLFRKGQ